MSIVCSLSANLSGSEITSYSTETEPLGSDHMGVLQQAYEYNCDV
jgi:hypothetical protein